MDRERPSTRPDDLSPAAGGECVDNPVVSSDEGLPVFTHTYVLDDATHGSASNTSADGASPDSRAMEKPSPGMLRLFGSETSKSSGRPPAVFSPGASPASLACKRAARSNSASETDSDEEEKNPYIKGNVTPPPRADAPTLCITDFSHKVLKKSPAQAMRWSTPELWHERSQRSPSHSSVRTFKFDSLWKSQTIRLSSDQTSVMYCHSGYGGFVTSEVPLRKRAFGRFFEIRIEDSSIARWNDGFGIGLVRRPIPKNPLAGGKQDPTPPHLQPEVLRRTRLGLDQPGAFDPARPFEAGVGYACEVMSESWMIGYDGRAKLKGVSRQFRGESELPAGPWRPSDLVSGDVVGLLATPESQLMLFVNGELRVCIGVPDLPGRTPLHVALDVDGCTRAIHLLDTDGSPSKTVLDQAKQFKKEHVPQAQAERWQSSIRHFRDQRAQPEGYTGNIRSKIHQQDSFEAHMQNNTLDQYFRQAGFSYDPATKTKHRPTDFTSSTQTQRNLARMRDTFPSAATRRAMSSPQTLRGSASSAGRSSSKDAFADLPSRRFPGLVAMLDS